MLWHGLMSSSLLQESVPQPRVPPAKRPLPSPRPAPWPRPPLTRSPRSRTPRRWWPPSWCLCWSQWRGPWTVRRTAPGAQSGSSTSTSLSGSSSWWCWWSISSSAPPWAAPAPGEGGHLLPRARLWPVRKVLAVKSEWIQVSEFRLLKCFWEWIDQSWYSLLCSRYSLFGGIKTVLVPYLPADTTRSVSSTSKYWDRAGGRVSVRPHSRTWRVKLERFSSGPGSMPLKRRWWWGRKMRSWWRTAAFCMTYDGFTSTASLCCWVSQGLQEDHNKMRSDLLQRLVFRTSF